MTVEENILAILETTVLTEEERVNKMNSLIEEFRIEHIRKSKGTELSGGERRRVEIARALATDPAFILLDEPFAGIDPIAVSDIQGMIAHLAKRGIGILITDHNVRETLSIVDKAYILANGEILIHGDSETIANDPTARKYYLGENFSNVGGIGMRLRLLDRYVLSELLYLLFWYRFVFLVFLLPAPCFLS